MSMIGNINLTGRGVRVPAAISWIIPKALSHLPVPRRLIIDLGGEIGLGDMVISTSFVREARRAFPQAEITLIGDVHHIYGVFGGWKEAGLVQHLYEVEGKCDFHYTDELSFRKIPLGTYDAAINVDNTHSFTSKPWLKEYARHVVGVHYQDYQQQFCTHPLAFKNTDRPIPMKFEILEKGWGHTVSEDQQQVEMKPRRDDVAVARQVINAIHGKAGVLSIQAPVIAGFYLGSGDLIGRRLSSYNRSLSPTHAMQIVHTILESLSIQGSRRVIPLLIYGKEEEKSYYSLLHQAFPDAPWVLGLTPGQLFLVMNETGFITSHDTGPAHIARATKTPLLVLNHHQQAVDIYSPRHSRMNVLMSTAGANDLTYNLTDIAKATTALVRD